MIAEIQDTGKRRGLSHVRPFPRLFSRHFSTYGVLNGRAALTRTSVSVMQLVLHGRQSPLTTSTRELLQRLD